jgi:hypothetical protein
MSDGSDGEVDDEDRVAAALAALALTRSEAAPIGGLARWRAERLAVLAEGTAGRRRRTLPFDQREGQRMLPVWPRENRPGCGCTHRPYGPARVVTVRSTRPVRVDTA